MKVTVPEISFHNRDPVLSVDVQHKSSDGIVRMATGGTDTHVVIWQLTPLDNGAVCVEALCDLARHNRAVNAVRFSPDGMLLASADDEAAIIVWKRQDVSGGTNAPDLFNDGEDKNRENWTIHKMLRGHIEDVYDLCWSSCSTFLVSGSIDNSAIMWEVNKGKNIGLLKDHKNFVQGVAWDPLGQFVATLSSDRMLRWFNISNKRSLHKVHKASLPRLAEDGAVKQVSTRLFYDDTLKSFCRRLSYSPDGLLLVVPAGILEEEDGTRPQNVVHVFTRLSPNRPVLYLPTGDKYTLAVRFCPLLFTLRTGTAGTRYSGQSVFALPYRMVFAVACHNCVLLYDTQQLLPFARISNMHYTRLTDLAWSGDGRILAISSTDGYCSLTHFEEGELGELYTKEGLGEKVIAQLKQDKKFLTPMRKKAGPKSVMKEKNSTPNAKEKLAAQPVTKEDMCDDTEGEANKENVVANGSMKMEVEHKDSATGLSEDKGSVSKSKKDVVNSKLKTLSTDKKLGSLYLSSDTEDTSSSNVPDGERKSAATAPAVKTNILIARRAPKPAQANEASKILSSPKTAITKQALKDSPAKTSESLTNKKRTPAASETEVADEEGSQGSEECLEELEELGELEEEILTDDSESIGSGDSEDDDDDEDDSDASNDSEDDNDDDDCKNESNLKNDKTQNVVSNTTPSRGVKRKQNQEQESSSSDKSMPIKTNVLIARRAPKSASAKKTSDAKSDVLASPLTKSDSPTPGCSSWEDSGRRPREEETVDSDGSESIGSNDSEEDDDDDNEDAASRMSFDNGEDDIDEDMGVSKIIHNDEPAEDMEVDDASSGDNARTSTSKDTDNGARKDFSKCFSGDEQQNEDGGYKSDSKSSSQTNMIAVKRKPDSDSRTPRRVALISLPRNGGSPSTIASAPVGSPSATASRKVAPSLPMIADDSENTSDLCLQLEGEITVSSPVKKRPSASKKTKASSKSTGIAATTGSKTVTASSSDSVTAFSSVSNGNTTSTSRPSTPSAVPAGKSSSRPSTPSVTPSATPSNTPSRAVPGGLSATKTPRRVSLITLASPKAKKSLHPRQPQP